MSVSANELNVAAAPRRSHTVGLVSLITIAVAVLGYVREAAIAARFGVTSTTDAYFAAVFVPYTLNTILIAGTLSPLLIQIIWREGSGETPSDVSETVSVVANFVSALMAAASALGIFTARWWLPLLFPGFDVATQQLAVRLTTLILPAIPFLALAGVCTAVLNGFHRFQLAAAAPALTSIAILVALPFTGSRFGVELLGVATAIGFFLQLVLVVAGLRPLAVRYIALFDFADPRIKQLLRLGAPLVAYLAVANISLLVERNLASQISTGAVSAFNYALRIFAVPANFLAAPIVMVAYPHFAREAARPDSGNLRGEVSRTLRSAAFIFAPLTVWTVMNALPITRLLYEHGHFTFTDSQLIARVLAVYSLGVLPNALTFVFLRCCYALQDTWTPLWAESANLVLYLSAAPFLAHHYGIAGLASARALSFLFVAAIFVVVLTARKGVLRVTWNGIGYFFRLAFASGVVVLILWAMLQRLPVTREGVRFTFHLTVLSLTAVSGLVVFFAAAFLLRLQEAPLFLHSARDLWRRFRA